MKNIAVMNTKSLLEKFTDTPFRDEIEYIAKSVPRSVDGEIIPVEQFYRAVREVDDLNLREAVCERCTSLVYAIRPIYIVDATKSAEPTRFLRVEEATDWLERKYRDADVSLGEFFESFDIDGNLEDIESIIFELRHRIDGWPTKQELARSICGA